MDYGWREVEWNGKQSRGREDIGRLDKISHCSERQNDNTTDVNAIENKVPSEAKEDPVVSAISSCHPALQERSQLEGNSVLAEGNKNESNKDRQLATLLLSSKELPSWAVRQTVLVVPPNNNSIAECQGCIKENGAPHTCDMKEEPLQFSNMPYDVYSVPSNQHSLIPPMTMNPHAPAWPEGQEMCLPSYRCPPMPPRRQDQYSYCDRRSFDRRYCEDCDDDDYKCYPLETCGRYYTHETTRGPQPPGAYLHHVNHNHSYSAIHDPAFLRLRHVEQHQPPPSNFQQYSARKYPTDTLPAQLTMGSGQQTRRLQNCSKYEPLQAITDTFVDRINYRGDWPQPEVEHSPVTYNVTPHSKESSVSLSTLSTTQIQSESHSDKLENHQLLQTPSLAGDFMSKAVSAFETKKSSEEPEVVSSAENKINVPEKKSSALPADDLKTPAIVSSTSSNNNKAIPSNNDLADSYVTVSEAVKHNKVLSVKIASADSTTAADVENENTPSGYVRKSPCAFTIDISTVGSSATDSFSAPKLPANLARRMTKFPHKRATKDDKAENTSQTNSPVTRRKKNSGLRSSRKLADDKDKQSLKFKDLQHVSSDNIDDDDDHDDNHQETYQGMLKWSKPLLWTKVETNSLSLRNDHYFKSSGPGLQCTSVAANLNRAKSATSSDGSHPEKMNNSHEAKSSLESERTFVQKDIPRKSSLYKFSNNVEQMSHQTSFQSDSSGEVSETETYTICTAEPNSAVLAAREKIDELFRVGIKDKQSEMENQPRNDRNDDLQSKSFAKEFISNQKGDAEEKPILEKNHLHQTQERIEQEMSIELATAVEVCQRSPDDVCQKNQKDSCLNVEDSDDVICLTYDSSKDSISDIKYKNDCNTSFARLVSTSPIRQISSSKRLLPRVPGKDDPADSDALVIEKATTRSYAGDSDKGFFEILSSDAPEMQWAEKKVCRPELNSYIKETHHMPHTDREFEVIADAPRLAEDAGLNKEKSQDDTLDFLRQNKVMRKSLNKKGSCSSSQAAEDEFKKIPFDAPRSGRLSGTTASHERDCVIEHKTPLHNRVGKLYSQSRFDDTTLLDEMSLNHSQRNLGGVSVTSKSRTIIDRTNNKGLISANEEFVPITSARSSGRPEGRRLPGSPTKPMNNTKSEFISRGSLGFGGNGSLRETNHEIGIDSNGANSSSRHSTPRLTSRFSSTKSQRQTENNLESRPPLSGSRQQTPVSKTMSYGSAIVPEMGTSSRTIQSRQRSLSRPPISRDDPQRSLSRTPLSRDEPTRQQLKHPKSTSFDSRNMTEATLLNQSKGHRSFRGRWLGETQKPEKTSSFDSEARMKRSKSASIGLRSRASDVENPKLQAYHERMKYDPKKAIQESKKCSRLSASSRSDDTDASSHEELQNHHFTRQRPGSMSYSSSRFKKASDFQPRGSFKSGGRPRSDQTRMPLDEGLNHSTSSEIETSQAHEKYGVHFTTIPSIQNLSEDIQQILKKIKQDTTRTCSRTQVTPGQWTNRATSSVNDPQLNELCKTLEKVKQVLQSKFHS